MYLIIYFDLKNLNTRHFHIDNLTFKYVLPLSNNFNIYLFRTLVIQT